MQHACGTVVATFFLGKSQILTYFTSLKVKLNALNDQKVKARLPHFIELLK